MYDLEEAQTTGAKRSVYESIRAYVEQPSAKSLLGIGSSASHLIEVAIIKNAPSQSPRTDGDAVALRVRKSLREQDSAR